MPEYIQSSDVLLSQILTDRPLGRYTDYPVGPLRLDSRQIEAGDTFIAVAGTHHRGQDYIDAALKLGARLVLLESEPFSITERAGVPVVTVPALRGRISALASHWFGQPSQLLSLVGVTGTNGKTTCCQWLAQLLDGLPTPRTDFTGKQLYAGTAVRAATIGTLGYGLVGGGLQETGLTTPDAIAVQSILAGLRRAGVNTVVAEVSSHSLDQDRVAAVDFDVAVFTNIGRDHLDYHGDLMSYVTAKTRLMRFASLKSAVINLDDEFAPQFLRQVSKDARTISYSLRSQDADFSATAIRFGAGGTQARLQTPAGEFEITVPIWGEFNLRNLLAVLAAGYALGFTLQALIGRLSLIRPVPGRLEPVADSADITVLIDYAHTPDALQSVLSAVRAHVKGNIWCVFGCGGDRDRGKRPLMGEVVESLADFLVVTSDNPRGEDPAAIIDDVVAGFQQPQAAHRIEDRETAIRFAIEQAAAGDCVLIAGKGHEDYQLVGTRRLPFSDLAVARLALKVRPAAGGSI